MSEVPVYTDMQQAHSLATCLGAVPTPSLPPLCRATALAGDHVIVASDDGIRLHNA